MYIAANARARKHENTEAYEFWRANLSSVEPDGSPRGYLPARCIAFTKSGARCSRQPAMNALLWISFAEWKKAGFPLPLCRQHGGR